MNAASAAHETRRHYSSGEPFHGSSFGLCRFFLPVSRRRAGFKRPDKTRGDFGYVMDRSAERGFVGLRWLVESADFPDELQRGGLDFLGRNGWIEVEQWLYVAAHR